MDRRCSAVDMNGVRTALSNFSPTRSVPREKKQLDWDHLHCHCLAKSSLYHRSSLFVYDYLFVKNVLASDYSLYYMK